MEFEQYGGYAKLGYEISDNWNAYADVNITHFNSTYPGPESAPLLEGDQRITRGVASVAMPTNMTGLPEE
jgi:iron complex outermembrane receptor protein